MQKTEWVWFEHLFFFFFHSIEMGHTNQNKSTHPALCITKIWWRDHIFPVWTLAMSSFWLVPKSRPNPDNTADFPTYNPIFSY